jgi:hypothetical protein
MRWQFAQRIEHNPPGIGARAMAHRQLGIVGEHGAGANYDRIDQGPQPMQMQQTLGAGHVVGMAAGGGDATIQALAQLANHQLRCQQGQVAIEQQGGVGLDSVSE